jgi:preprotein translocase subunit YajC
MRSDVSRRPQAAVFFAGRRHSRRRVDDSKEVSVLGLFTPLAASSSSGGSSVQLIGFLLVMGGIFYFLLIRPQQRRAKQQRALIDSVDIGDEVMTIGGVFGTVQAIDDEAITLEVADGVDIRFVKSAIARKLVYDDNSYDEDEDADQSEEAEEEAGDSK